MIEWMKEILGDAYTEDIDNKITARLTADYAPKADLEAANTAKSEAEAALAAANDKYKDVDIDALRADAEKYKAEAAQARKDADERVAAVQFDGKLDAAITAAHGRSAKAIRALLDVDTLKGSDKQDEAITAALAINGEPLNSATATVTPAAVENYFNIYVSAIVEVPRGCCLTVAMENTSRQAISVANANMTVDRIS